MTCVYELEQTVFLSHYFSPTTMMVGVITQRLTQRNLTVQSSGIGKDVLNIETPRLLVCQLPDTMDSCSMGCH